MSQIPDNQGAIKISEVAIDRSQNVFGTLDQEDGLTFVVQVRKVAANLLRKTSFLLISDGVITWNGSIIVNNGNNVLLKFNQNPTAGVVTITMPTSVLSTFVIGNMQILYFKCSRSALASSFTATGSNFVVSTEGSMPAMSAPQSDTIDDPTIFVPLLARYDVGSNQAAWWVPHGIYWPQNTTSVIGSIITGTNLPNGTIVPLHRPGGTYPLGTPGLLAQEPGWALCDGAVIVDAQSPYNNPGRNPDGFPNALYNPADDRFAPTMNGRAPAWATATSYIRGDAVTNASGTVMWVAMSNFVTGVGSGWDPNSALPAAWSFSTAYAPGNFVLYTAPDVNGSGQPFTGIYRAINSVGPSSTPPFLDTVNWQNIWGTDTTQNGNPFKRSGFNGSTVNPPNTYVRGSYGSASSPAAHGGANTHTLSVSEMPTHSHTFAGNTGTQNVNHTHSGVTDYTSVIARYSTNENDDGTHSVLFDDGDQGDATIPKSSHRHSFTTGINSVDHRHDYSGTTTNTGGGQAHNNEPRFMNTVMIIKIY